MGPDCSCVDVTLMCILPSWQRLQGAKSESGDLSLPKPFFGPGTAVDAILARGMLRYGGRPESGWSAREQRVSRFFDSEWQNTANSEMARDCSLIDMTSMGILSS